MGGAVAIAGSGPEALPLPDGEVSAPGDAGTGLDV